MFINSDHEQTCGDQVNVTNANSCQFYINCIEQHFPCLENGFAIGYAEKRCQAILDAHSEGSTTFSSPHIRQWTMHHETCLRGKLLHLLRTFINSSKPDQPVCLQMETLAFKAVEECYNETREEFCPSDSNGLTLDLSDSSQLAQLFSLNDLYYKYTVNQGLARLLSACNHSSADSATQALNDQVPQRVVICARHYDSDLEVDNQLIRGTEYVQNMSLVQSIHIPTDQLVYGGHVLYTENTEEARLARECFISARPWVRSGRVHLLLWSVPPEVKLPAPVEGGKNLIDEIVWFADGSGSLEVWLPKVLHTKSECGDGVRQATEMCDSGIFFGEAYTCTLDCRPWEGFECSGDPLTRADCKKQICGDGIRTSDEECDNKNGDGCVNCTVQTGWDCQSDYLGLSRCTRTAEPPTTPSQPTTSQPATTAPPTTRIPITVPDSAGTMSTHLIVVVASVLIALVVSGGLSSALPGTGGDGVLHDTSINRQGQRRKSEEVLDASARPCRSEAWDCISRCLPHESATVPLTTE